MLLHYLQYYYLFRFDAIILIDYSSLYKFYHAVDVHFRSIEKFEVSKIFFLSVKGTVHQRI